MNQGQFENLLLQSLRRIPFQPFTVEFDDGESIVVGEPRALHYGGGDTAIFFGADEPLMFHSEAVRRIVDLVPSPPNP